MGPGTVPYHNILVGDRYGAQYWFGISWGAGLEKQIFRNHVNKEALRKQVQIRDFRKILKWGRRFQPSRSRPAKQRGQIPVDLGLGIYISSFISDNALDLVYGFSHKPKVRPGPGQAFSIGTPE